MEVVFLILASIAAHILGDGYGRRRGYHKVMTSLKDEVEE